MVQRDPAACEWPPSTHGAVGLFPETFLATRSPKLIDKSYEITCQDTLETNALA